MQPACSHRIKKTLPEKMPSRSSRRSTELTFGGSVTRDGLGLIMLPFVPSPFAQTITDPIWYSVRLLLWPNITSLPLRSSVASSQLNSSTRAYWPLWFLGKYTQAHVDPGPHVCNCYFLRKASDVLLIPPEVAKNIPLTPGLDGMYIEGSESEKREYRGDLPYYYRVDLPAQSMLCFNNTSTIHHFKNCDAVDGSTPEALSIRIRHCCCPEPRVWCHMTFPWFGWLWWRFTVLQCHSCLASLRRNVTPSTSDLGFNQPIFDLVCQCSYGCADCNGAMVGFYVHSPAERTNKTL